MVDKVRQFDTVEAKESPLLSLRPHGVGFSDIASKQEEMDNSIDETVIKACRDEFIADCGYDVARTSVRESPFICKPKFIIDRENQNMSEKVLISLLADRSTLFSSQYQIYSSDHAFYRAVRKSLGRTRTEQREICMQKAQEHCADSWDIYGPILKEVQAFAIKKNVSVCKLERELVMYAIADFTADAENMEQEYYKILHTCISGIPQYLLENVKTLSLSDLEVQKLIGDYFSMFDNGHVPMSEFFIRLSRHLPLDGEKVLYKLHKWLPNSKIGLSEAAAARFVPDALCPYCRCEEQQYSAGEASGHYRTTIEHHKITDAERAAFRQYQLDRKELEAWAGLTFSLPFKERSGFYTDMSTPALIQPPHLSEICNATKQYLIDSGSTINPEQSCEIYVARLISQIKDGCTDTRLSPFAYLVIATLGKGRIFSGSYCLENDQILDFSKHVYRAKPAKSKQRIYRLRFLSELCRLFDLPVESCLLNLKYFLYFHGSKIESADEAALWGNILISLRNRADDVNAVSIPPIEIQMTIDNRIDGIISFEPESQYCYRSSSPLHLGGYAEFLNQYRPLLDQCVHNLAKQKDSRWPHIVKKYLSFWSSPEVDREEIRKFCDICMKETDWKTEFPHQRIINKFCKELCSSQQGNVIHVSDCQEELNLLLFEAVVRLVLIKQATDILLRKSQSLLHIFPTKAHVLHLDTGDIM